MIVSHHPQEEKPWELFPRSLGINSLGTSPNSLFGKDLPPLAYLLEIIYYFSTISSELVDENILIGFCALKCFGIIPKVFVHEVVRDCGPYLSCENSNFEFAHLPNAPN